MNNRDHNISKALIAAAFEVIGREAARNAFKLTTHYLFIVSLLSDTNQLPTPHEEVEDAVTMIYHFILSWNFHCSHPHGLGAELSPIIDYVVNQTPLEPNSSAFLSDTIRLLPDYFMDSAPIEKAMLRLVDHVHQVYEGDCSADLDDEGLGNYTVDETGVVYCDCSYCAAFEAVEEEVEEKSALQEIMTSVSTRLLSRLESVGVEAAPAENLQADEPVPGSPTL
jgi:hypothetical protein